jgi:folate-binding protein YgfZ
MTVPTLQDLAAAQRAAVGGALIQLRSDLAAFAITGRDRASWLNGLVTCDLASLAPGGGAYGLAVGKTGRISAELWILAGSDRLLVGLDRGRAEAIREHLERHLIMEDAEIGPPLDRGFVFAHGPLAAELVDAARALGADAAQVDWTGRRDAAVILAPEGRLDAVKAGLLARAGDRGAEASAEGWEALRIAWGLPRAGVDFDDQTMPQEASLEKVAVSFTKGCYLGQEAVFMLEKRGHPKKKLMRLAVEGDASLPEGAEIALPEGSDAIGVVTSATARPEGGGLLALGYVKYKHAAADTALVVGGRPAHVLGPAADMAPAPAPGAGQLASPAIEERGEDRGGSSS